VKNVLVLVLGLLVFGPVPTLHRAAAAATPPAGRPWVLVQADGMRVTFETPPQERSGRLVGRLRGSGTLVSIPTARVDAAATERANAPGAAASPRPPRVAPTPRPFETRPLGDRVRMTANPEDARRVLEGARIGTPAPAAASVPQPATIPAVAPVPEEKAPTDRFGRGEAYWRERAGAARGVLDEAERALAEAEANLREADRASLGMNEAERNSFIIRVIEARDLAEKARTEHRSAKGRWELLLEEARKSEAFPGWLR
jgi:hypothetical protein